MQSVGVNNSTLDFLLCHLKRFQDYKLSQHFILIKLNLKSTSWRKHTVPDSHCLNKSELNFVFVFCHYICLKISCKVPLSTYKSAIEMRWIIIIIIESLKPMRKINGPQIYCLLGLVQMLVNTNIKHFCVLCALYVHFCFLSIRVPYFTLASLLFLWLSASPWLYSPDKIPLLGYFRLWILHLHVCYVTFWMFMLAFSCELLVSFSQCCVFGLSHSFLDFGFVWASLDLFAMLWYAGFDLCPLVFSCTG